MESTDPVRDKRTLSGQRVIARGQVVVKTCDPFASWDPVKTGHVVLNVRGGCLYLGEYFDEKNIFKLFPHEGRGTFIKMTLSADRRPDVVLEEVHVAFQRIKRTANREGVVFSFLDVTGKQLDTLFDVVSAFPAIGRDEESSVPFDEIISLDRTGHSVCL